MPGCIRKLQKVGGRTYIPVPRALADVTGFSTAKKVLISVIDETKFLVEIFDDKDILKDGHKRA